MTDSEYTCACCKETFLKDWSDEEAEAECEKLFPGYNRENQVVVCDDCYQKIMQHREQSLN